MALHLLDHVLFSQDKMAKGGRRNKNDAKTRYVASPWRLPSAFVPLGPGSCARGRFGVLFKRNWKQKMQIWIWIRLILIVLEVFFSLSKLKKLKKRQNQILFMFFALAMIQRKQHLRSSTLTKLQMWPSQKPPRRLPAERKNSPLRAQDGDFNRPRWLLSC